MHGALHSYMEHNTCEASSEKLVHICSSCIKKEITCLGNLGKPSNCIIQEFLTGLILLQSKQQYHWVTNIE